MKWILKKVSHLQENIINNLSEQLGITTILSRLLTLRGINDFESTKNFFRPDLDKLHNPFIMEDMQKAVERLHKAIQQQEKILIYGDYDVDGTTAVASMFKFLQKLNVQTDYYIPDRFEEGYGLSQKGVEYAVHNKFSLIIILDCGIKEVERIQYAQAHNIDCIICDHHLPGEIIPPAFAILNPKKTTCNYPYKELSGCGIGFKLTQAYVMQYKLSQEYYLQNMDLLALSIAADIVPITDENRILAYYGLQKIQTNPCAGIKALLDVSFSRRNSSIRISDLVFSLAPRINAAGRINHASEAVNLLITENYNEALIFSKKLQETNAQRQNIDKQTFEEALQIIESDAEFNKKKTTVVYKDNWNKGVVGIVASRLIEKYYRPTIVLTKHDGYITGSARGIDEFDLYNALMECKDMLHQFGGHKHAAGLSLQEENLQTFKNMFDAVAQSNLSDEVLEPTLEIDAEITLSDITPKFLRILKQMEPHGPENMTPVFLIKKVKDMGRMHEFSNGHLKLHLTQNDLQEYPAVFFRGAAQYDSLVGKWFDIVVKIQIDGSNSSDTPLYTLIIEDIKVS